MSKITSAVSGYVLALCPAGVLVQLRPKWPFLPHLKQIDAGLPLHPAVPGAPGEAEPGDIPGGGADALGVALCLAAGLLPLPLLSA